MATISYKTEQNLKKAAFLEFIENEGFIESTDRIGSFETHQPLFYKRITENTFLVFNIPYFEQIKNAFFQADFWEVEATSEIEFLKKKMHSSQIKTIRLGFTLERDLELYSKYLLNTRVYQNNRKSNPPPGCRSMFEVHNEHLSRY